MIVSAARQVTGYLGPAIAVDGVELKDLDILLVRPLYLLDARIQMIVPPDIKRKKESALMIIVYASHEHFCPVRAQQFK